MRLAPLLFMFIAIFVLVANKSVAGQKTQFVTGLQTDVPIGKVGDVSLTLNIAVPDKPNKEQVDKLSPAFVFIHGGGLVKGDKNKFNRRITQFAQRGVVGVSVMYRFAPEHRFPAAIEDVKAAIRFLKANAKPLNLDPNRIFVAGISAGGYVATMIGVTGNASGFSDLGIYPEFDASVRGVISQSGSIADFTSKQNRDFVLVKRFINNDMPDREAALAAMSPLTYLDKNDPPFFLVHGSADKVVPVEMTREFAVELKKIGHEFIYIEVEGGNHSLTRSHPEKASEVFRASLAFIKKHGF